MPAPSANDNQLELVGLQEIEARLRELHDIDFSPLMEAWEVVLQDDNRRGLLAGLDGEGNPLEDVTYRPKPVKSIDYRILDHNNLASSHYRSLDGPPLVPRGEKSRAITNFVTAHAKLSDDRWAVVGAWEDVLDVHGNSFLHYHFDGEGQKRRDLRGVRPQALAEAGQALDQFLDQVLGDL